MKNLSVSVGDLGSIPELERSPGEGKGYQLVFLPGLFHKPEEPGELHSMGSKRVGHD